MPLIIPGETADLGWQAHDYAEDLYPQIKLYEPVAFEPLTEIQALEKPAPRTACKFVDAENPVQLIDLLQNEAKII